MTYAEPQQIKQIHTLLHQLPGMDAAELEEYKRGQVRAFSNGREESTKKLTPGEAGAFIQALQAVVQPTKLPGDAMRKKIIHMAHMMFWELPGGRADMKRINGWCEKSSYLHKPLNEYTTAELPMLVSQFELVYRSFVNGVNK